MGATPLSTPTRTRGKSTSGKTATGTVVARYTPAATSVRITKMIGLPCRAVQCSSLAIIVVVFIVFVVFILGACGFLARLHDAHLGLVLQPKTADGDDAFAGRDA